MRRLRSTISVRTTAEVLCCREPVRRDWGHPTGGSRKRSKHGAIWFRQSKANHLTAMPIESRYTRPCFGSFNEDVDRPQVAVKDAPCFNCKKPVDTSVWTQYLWVPSGNAQTPTKQGYFFHIECFRCWSCKQRIPSSLFYSKDGRAWCVTCALGQGSTWQYRKWHIPTVNPDRMASRMTGHFFPRHKHQMEFLFNPDE